MPNSTYAWKRFWCPRDANINLGYDGYLPDPESELERNLNPHIVPFDALTDISCLALLGEPGIGKSSAMRTEKEAIDARVKSQGDQTLWLNLHSYGNESRLIHDLFESPTFTSWREANCRLHIFLDSLDECLLRIDHVAALLVEEFAKYPHERLFLRIACRTADWPDALETGLRGIWGKEATRVYELAPLRRKDIVEAAGAEGLDVDGFVDEIDQKEVAPLAIKPITLAFLLNKYRKDAKLPSGQVELYESGCHLLCAETNEDRIASRAIGNLNSDQRLIVAARVAAITVFANRDAIWRGIDRGDVPDADVTLGDLYGGQESVKGNSFEINEGAIRETLSTGLFVASGLNRLSWTHQTYAEFLAARYLFQHNMPLAQLMRLILSSGGFEKKLVPQLRETATWLASMRPDVFREIVGLEPEMLLRSDVAAADPADRVALVQALLDGYDSEQLIDRDWGTRRLYRKLDHPQLAVQLRPYITDCTKGVMVRYVAVDIAEACEAHALENDLLAIASDHSEVLTIRESATHAIWSIGDADAKAHLRPLAMGKGGYDPNDILKGYGLLATWPEHLTAQELFDSLTPPKNESLYGGYQQFLYSGFSEKIQPADLPLALNWVIELSAGHKVSYHLRESIDAILLRAWQYLDSPGVLDGLTHFALAQFQQFRGLLESDGPHGRSAAQLAAAILHEDHKRHQFLVSVLSHIESKDAVFLLTQLGHHLVFRSDVPWMLEYSLTISSPVIKSSLAHLINWVFDRDNPRQIEAVFNMTGKESVFAAEFATWFAPVVIGTPEAQELKARYLEMQRWRQPKEKPLLEPTPAERISGCLEAIETGDTEKWWSLCMEMTLKPDSDFYENESEPDLHKLPGWTLSNATTRARITTAAKAYILERDADPDRWLGTNDFYRPATAGYKALYLLMEEEPSFLSALPDSVWRKWASIIADYPFEFREQKDARHSGVLLKMAYDQAPDEVIDVAMKLIDKENVAPGNIFGMRTFEDCWDARFATAILAKAQDKTLKPPCMGDLLQTLLKHGDSEARAFAQTMISLPVPPDGEEHARAFAAAYALVTQAQDAGWSVVWPTIQGDAQFGREVFEAMPYSDRHTGSVWTKLSEAQLSDLYIWLVRQYPFEDDPHSDGFHTVSSREQIAQWRNMLLSHLQGRGTYESCEGIQRIVAEFPTRLHIKRALLEARTFLRRQTWTPLHPADITKMVHDKAPRYIQSGYHRLDLHVTQLLEILIGATPSIDVEQAELVPCLEALCSLLGTYAKGAVFKDTKAILEREFQPLVLRDLRLKLGEDVQEHLSQAGGYTDICYRGVVIELKVEEDNGDRSYICQKYTKQATQYEGVEARQVSVVLVLDITPKHDPPGDIRNDILLVDVPTHGGKDDEKKHPSKAFVFVINGNLQSPSAYSR